ncbi:MAG: type II toxin-antitoxin system VapC family toxin [Nitrospirales bacterium]|nr:type II toxin-antitoxin system VapC family toxin [Nitrospirales bacterium]
MKKVFLDTNIVLDFLDKRRKHHQKSEELMASLVSQNCPIYISEDMLSTIFYIDKDNRKVLKFFEIIAKEWHIVSFGQEVIPKAIALCIGNEELDFEDVLQCLCAKAHGCEFLATNDKGFVDCGITVADYDTALAMCEADRLKAEG